MSNREPDAAAAAAAAAASSSRYYNDFEDIEEIGRGGFGTVVKVRQLRHHFRAFFRFLFLFGFEAICTLRRVAYPA